jgi:hypothetical protein
MLRADARRVGTGDTSTIDIQVLVWADGSSGIERVAVIGSDGRSIRDFTGACAAFLEQVIPRVPRTSLPVIVRATDCEQPPQTFTSSPLLGEERPTGQGPGGVICPPPSSTGAGYMPPPPENQACREAQAEITSLRNQIINGCRQIDLLRDRRNAYLAAWAIASALAIAALIAAALIPIPFAKIALYITAAILAVIAIGFLIAAIATQAELDAAISNDNRVRDEFRRRVSSLSNICCPEHIHVATDEPRC